MPMIDLTDAEHAAIRALIRRAVEQDRFPRASHSAPCAPPSPSSTPPLPRPSEACRRPNMPSPHPSSNGSTKGEGERYMRGLRPVPQQPTTPKRRPRLLRPPARARLLGSRARRPRRACGAR
jgi:hypothetical protein